MAHICVKRFSPRHRQKHTPQNDKTNQSMTKQKVNALQGIKGIKNFWRIANMRKPHHCNRTKPQQHNGAEQIGDTRRARLLHAKERDQNHNRDDQHIGFKQWCDEFQAFNR